MLLKKCTTMQTGFDPIHVLTTDSNTLCTTDIELGKLVTVGMVVSGGSSRFCVVDSKK